MKSFDWFSTTDPATS